MAYWYSRSPMEVGRRKKEEAVIAMVSAVKNVLTVLAVAITLIFYFLRTYATDTYSRVRLRSKS
ncbi:MAG TPA: hypothetical protein VIQ31_28165, partial [Phormidium sp.]